MAKSSGARSPRPSRDALVAFINERPGRTGRREIARAFALKAGDRAWLRETLAELAGEGLIEGRVRGRHRREGLPPVAVLEVTGTDADGDLLATPATWTAEGPPPMVLLKGSPRSLAAAPGERVLARLRGTRGGGYEGRILRHLPSPPAEILGVIEDTGGEPRLRPVNRRVRTEFLVDETGDAQAGDVVVADVVGGPSGRAQRRALGPVRVRVRERIGALDDPATLSLTAIHEHGLVTAFGQDALAEAAAARDPELESRTDLREVPFVTIDPDTARDFDDAVWAEPDPDHPGGWVARIAIADVAQYVAPGSALDREARQRGNSAYFPDRVVPMLPEALSAGMCSLKAGEDRACMAVTLWLDASGTVRRHRFERGLMRTALRLTYTQAQAIHNGADDDRNAAELLANLYGAHAALDRARTRREPLAIETPELEVRLGADGHVSDIRPAEHFESHRLVEDLMIAANVAAAEVLADAGVPAVYRIHDEPERERVEALRQFLDSLGYRLARGQRLVPRQFNDVLRKTAGGPFEHALHQAVLRTQAQAEYSTAGSPHFGLALGRYVHFTSPIRRYADLCVHRALIAVLGLGASGAVEAPEALAATARHISMTERQATAAERDALDRYLAAFLADQVGAVVQGRISGVTRAGLFVTLAETGADGLAPMRSLGDDFFHVDEAGRRLIGERTHRVYRLGDAVEVRILEATAATGGLMLEVVAGGTIDASARVPRRRQGPGRKR